MAVLVGHFLITKPRPLKPVYRCTEMMFLPKMHKLLCICTKIKIEVTKQRQIPMMTEVWGGGGWGGWGGCGVGLWP